MVYAAFIHTEPESLQLRVLTFSLMFSHAIFMFSLHLSSPMLQTCWRSQS